MLIAVACACHPMHSLSRVQVFDCLPVCLSKCLVLQSVLHIPAKPLHDPISFLACNCEGDTAKLWDAAGHLGGAWHESEEGLPAPALVGYGTDGEEERRMVLVRRCTSYVVMIQCTAHFCFCLLA